MGRKRFFEDKVCVVTGAGSGIGRATALTLARQRARVHVVDIRGDRVESVCHEVGAGAVGHVVDCSDPAATEVLAREVFAAEGRVDLLQNGAGVVVAAPLERIPLEDWRWIVDHNLWSVVHGVRAFVPRMLGQGGPRSHVVNIASAAGLVGMPLCTAYSATKAAVVGLSEALGAEVHGRGVSVHCICPGMVRSNLLADGRLALPGAWGERLRWIHDHLGPGPEATVREILAAVRHDRPLVAPSVEFQGAWLLKRASAGAYNRVVRQLMRLGTSC